MNNKLYRVVFLILMWFNCLYSAFELHCSSQYPLPDIYSTSPVLNLMLNKMDKTGFVPKIRLMATYKNQFGLKELTYNSIHGVVRFRRFQLGIKLNEFGPDGLYEERVAETGLLYNLRNRLSIGFSISHYQLAIRGLPRSNITGINLGCVAELEYGLIWSVYMHNIILSSSQIAATELPRIINSTFRIIPTEKLQAIIQWEQDLLYPGRLGLGAAFQVVKWLTFSAGYNGNPGQLVGGLQINKSKVKIEYLASFHQELGVSQVLGVGYHIDR